MDTTTILLAITLVIITYAWLTSRKNNKGPPRVPSLPFLGSFPYVVLFYYRKFVKDSPAAFIEMTKKFGPIYTLDFIDGPNVFVHGYDAIKEVLTTKGQDFAGRLGFVLGEDFNPKQLGIIEGNYTSDWKEQRNFSILNLKKFGFGKRSFESRILEEVEYLLDVLRKQNGKAFDIRPYLANSVSNVICIMVFGQRYDHDDERFRHLLNMIRKFVTVFEDDPFAAVLLMSSWTRKLPKVTRVMQKFTKIRLSIMEFCKEQIEEHQNTLDPENPRDFIDGYLIEMNKSSDPSYSVEQLNFILFDFFLGGSETTATVLQWAMVYMANNPDVQEKIQTELDNVAGKGRMPSLHDQGQLPYTEATLLELQRISVIVPLSISHVAMRDTEIQGYKIPVGTTCRCNLQSVLKDPKLWPEPETFRPERFLSIDGELVRNEHLIPFSSGPRVCPGQQLAKQELFLFFTSILHRFSIECPPGVNKMSEIPKVAGTRTPQPFQICIKER